LRLAFGLGRTRAELRESLTAAEWDDWLRFHTEYDLPDAYMTTGVLGALVASVAGNKARPEDFVPYYRPDRPRRHDGLAGAFRFLQEVHGQQRTG
jgi:hypothetical protein